jgi:N-acetylglucosaminyl-diphospho-decaprenol L-rhamnosyltransferase
VAVVTHNSAADLERFLAGQAELARRLEVPLIVVDNGSTDATPDLLRSSDADIELVAWRDNRGYAAAVNAAVAATADSDVLLLNPDVEAPTREGVGSLVEFAARHPRTAVVAPRLLYPDSRPQPSARRFPSLLAMLGSIGAVARLAPARRSYEDYLSPSWAEVATPVDWVIGAAMLLRRAAFDAVGGWDERFFLYMEDADYCRRCWRAGFETWLVPSVSVRHGYARASSTEASVFGSAARRRHLASLARFFAREPRLLFGRGRR